jgi:trehalose 6-phosphate synthase/phosphatase
MDDSVRRLHATKNDASAQRDPSVAPTHPDILALVRRIHAAPHLLLLLDYDGTLVPFADVPALATPDDDLRTLLAALAARRRTELHLVSGRPRETIEEWFGDLRIGLHAEHGFWSRPMPEAGWQALAVPATYWRERILSVLTQFAAEVPGALVEEKTASLAWHYRMVDPELAAGRVNELCLRLTESLGNARVEILAGEQVIEVRPLGVNKGTVVAPLLARMPSDGLVVAVGDGRTDEDLFAALPPEAIAVHVGPGPTCAPIRFAGVADVRRFLAALLEDPGD